MADRNIGNQHVTASAVSQFFDRYAGDFDAIYGTRNTLVNRVVNRFLRRSMRLRFERTLRNCEPIEGKSVLDVGCGPGHYAVALAAGGAQKVLGIDFAPAMIALSQERARRQGVADRCEFRVADFLNVEIAQRFDYAVVMGFMDYVAEPLALVRRVLAVTRERAMFSFPVAGGLLGWQRRLRYRRRCELFLYTGRQVSTLFHEAGAEDVVIEKIARDFFVSARPPVRARPHRPRRASTGLGVPG
jgi:SAM-dependent methyltransferase